MTSEWSTNAIHPAGALSGTLVRTPYAIDARPVEPLTIPDRWYRLAKRALDISLVIGLAPVWVPMYGAASLAIAVLEGRPIHYRDRRVGTGGRDLKLLKLRTMSVNASDDLMALLEGDPALKAEFVRFAKLHSDPRLTPLGRVLRRLSLDELPQLLHVLRGEMSLVGPRPLTRWEIEQFYGDEAHELLSVPPGLTGLWQISGRSLLSFERRVPLDLAYVRNRSIALDLKILLRTIPKVARGHGAI